MQFLILVPLLLHVFAYRLFVSVLAHCAGEVPVRPKLATPQFLPHLRTAFENLSGRYAFDHRHNLCHAVSGNRLHQKMNVIFVRSNFQKLDLVPLFDSKARLFEYLVNLFIDYSPSVLRRKHDVVQQYRDVVTLVYVFAHPRRLRPKGRGIDPQ